MYGDQTEFCREISVGMINEKIPRGRPRRPRLEDRINDDLYKCTRGITIEDKNVNSNG